MSKKRSTDELKDKKSSPNKKVKTSNLSNTYLFKTLHESGLILKHVPDKSICTEEIVLIIRNIKKNLKKHFEYPRNVAELYADLEKECDNKEVFKHFLFPNIVRISEDCEEEIPVNDSVIKILLNIPILQPKLTDYIFQKATDFAANSAAGPWIQMILRSFSSLDNIVDTDKISTHLIDLLDISSEKMVRLEIIISIPDIIGDQEHNNVANELSRILSEDHDLIPAILDCLSYLCLSDDQYEVLQKKALNILMTLSKCSYFPNFVKFLLMTNNTSDSTCLEVVGGLRSSLGWSTATATSQEIATSQVLTAAAIRTSMVSSKVVSNAWMKVVSNCKLSTDQKPIDFILLLILYSISDEKQKQVENLIRKQVKLNTLKEELLDETFEKFKPILKDQLKNLISLTNSMLKSKSDPLVEALGSHIYLLMFSHLEDCCQTIVGELLQLGLDSKDCVMSMLVILNNVASKNMSLLKSQSLQMLTLMDRMDDMSLSEVRAVMNVVCGLAYTFENSVIKDDIHMIVRKELSSSNPAVKIQGILAGIHAVKYLMTSNENEDNTVDFPDDISYSSVNHLSEGDLREAAQIIELISRSTRQYPDMIAFFYDELTKIIKSANFINKHFLAWLTDAVTNDLQQNFIVDSIENERINGLRLSMEYCLNEEGEMDEVIGINIAGLTLQMNPEVVIGILSPLFLLVQTLHYKQSDGNLTSIDALLGCPVVMPKFDIDSVDNMDLISITNILNCYIHCVNWFRELLNAFATQEDDSLKRKVLLRIITIEEMEAVVSNILINTKISYKPPLSEFNIGRYTGENVERLAPKSSVVKSKNQKKDDTHNIVESGKTQATQNNNSVKSNLETLHSIKFRALSSNILCLLSCDLAVDNDTEVNLSIKMLKFIVKCVNGNLEDVLISKVKRNTFLTKHVDAYDPKKAEQCAKTLSEVLPKVMNHLRAVTDYIESHTLETSQNDGGFMYTSEMIDYLTCLESLYKMLTIYFKWIGFRNQHNALFKSSLRTIASADNASVASLKDIFLAVAKYLQKQEKYCLQLSTAIALIGFVEAIEEHSDNTIVLRILRDMAQNFLAQQWRTPDGSLEKGLHLNQSIDKLTGLFLLNSAILDLKKFTLELSTQIQLLKGRNDTLNLFKCINKANFPILYRNLGNSLHGATKSHLSKGLTNAEHLGLWKDVVLILKCMSDIAKTLETRNTLTAYFKKSLPVLKLFLSQGIPILELQFKSDTQEVLEILKVLQQSTRFLQTLCCHSRLKKDTALMSKVPYMRQLLETLIYKVKAALAANNCSEAFWMGNLKNKNIHGEIISTQQSVESEESVEDCDDQLLEDESSGDSDDEMLNPDSRSVSDIV